MEQASLWPEGFIQAGTPGGMTLLWLHGLGADGHDFESVIEQLDRAMPFPVQGLLPHAPIRPVTLNQGYAMRAWFDMVDLEHPRRISLEDLEESTQMVLQQVRQWVDGGLSPESIFLAGFSQGGGVVLKATLESPFPLGGCLALSTTLFGLEQQAPASHDVGTKIPVFQAHGTDDPIIPIAQAEHTAQWLRDNGSEVEYRIYSMAHSFCQEELQDLAQWLLAHYPIA